VPMRSKKSLEPTKKQNSEEKEILQNSCEVRNGRIVS